MTVGEKVKMLRERLNWTQDDLAKAVGYKSRTTIGKIESGENDPTQKNLMKLAAALGVSPAQLLEDDEDKAKPPKTREARIISHGVDGMPPEERAKAVNLFKMMFEKYADKFEEGEDDDDEGQL